jgi:hypothetical protein
VTADDRRRTLTDLREGLAKLVPAALAEQRRREQGWRLPYRPSWRDRLAGYLANAALSIASKEYRALLRGAYLLGLDRAAKEMDR